MESHKHEVVLLEDMRKTSMEEVTAMVQRIAPTLVHVLLIGETGVGKDVIAERIHALSGRGRAPFLRLNCAGLSPDLLESELFGHERGAFTGALQTKRGLLEVSAGGTVFLDEIAEMPLEVQAKLLLMLEQRTLRRVGGTRSLPVDVRFIFATHCDLQDAVKRGRFRADFYYRINGLTIHIPPLRERCAEIAGLAETFARDACARLGRAELLSFDPLAMTLLQAYAWPGNIRELRSVIERAVILTDSPVLTRATMHLAGLRTLSNEDTTLADVHVIGSAERARVVAALAECGGNQSRAAKLLGIARNTLIAKLRKFDVMRPRASTSRVRGTQHVRGTSELPDRKLHRLTASRH